jgi:hypothetical protein
MSKIKRFFKWIFYPKKLIPANEGPDIINHRYDEDVIIHKFKASTREDILDYMRKEIKERGDIKDE